MLPWLTALAPSPEAPLLLSEVPDRVLDEIRSDGFDGIWLMGAWTTGPRARRLALGYPDLLATYEKLLPKWTPRDVGGSCYSIADYSPPDRVGGRDGLRHLRARLNARGLGLVLDFVPNHLGIDHPWLDERPELLVRGTPRDLAAAPDSWFVHTTLSGEDRIFSHGRDPNFAGWSDTVQVDHRRRDARDAMTDLFVDIASLADGLRCDMAMLQLGDVFHRTWGDGAPEEAGEFWPAAIGAARQRFPELALIAEAYWGLEDRLCDLGFDWAYDKELYDRLCAGDVDGVREQIALSLEHHSRRVHFLENHDEKRAWASFGPRRSAAAAVALYGLPGLRFFQLGQVQGHRHRPPVQLDRYPVEKPNARCRKLYQPLLAALNEPAFHAGTWSALTFSDVEEKSAAGMVGSRWDEGDLSWFAIANLGTDSGRAHVAVEVAPGSSVVRFEDPLTGEHFEHARDVLIEHGLFVELARGKAHLFRCADLG